MKKTCIVLLLVLLLPICCGACAEGSGKGKVLVALGDSYTAGEGIEPYYGQDAPEAEKCRNPDWVGHRSEACWPGMLKLPGVEGVLADRRGENFFIAASSGARTNHLFLLTEEERKNGMTAVQEKECNREGFSGKAQIPPQLDIFDELDEKGLKADYVVLTIGGNDVDFKGVTTRALLGLAASEPGETDAEKGAALMEELYAGGNVRKRIKRAFQDVAARAGDQACILAAGYPSSLIDDTADSVFKKENARVLSEACAFFCAELVSIVEECRKEGMKICYVDVSNAFKGHGAYSEDPYINPLTFPAKEQDLNPGELMSSCSLHPNLKGAEAYARCVQDAIDRLEAGSDEYIFDWHGQAE